MDADTPTAHQRADAARNRERLLDVARRAFSSGRDTVTLQAIAKEAGVGIGTLYRHFPNREALVEAVYRGEVGRLRRSADELLAAHAPDVALRLWMDMFAEHVATKRGMAETLRAVMATGAVTVVETRQRLGVIMRDLLAAGAAAGTVRADVNPDDVILSLVGVLLVSDAVECPEQTARLLDLLMDGLRPDQGAATV